MILQSKNSKGQIKIKEEEPKELIEDKHIEPLEDTDLDALLKKIESVEIKEENVIKEPEQKKNLSILKKVSGVVDYFLESKKDKIKSSIPKYLYDLTMDILYNKKCQQYSSSNNIIYVRLPLIVISNNYFSNFISFLENYYLYNDYKDNINLLKFLILSDESIKKYEPFHDSPKNYTFVSECINTGLINHYDVNQIIEINKNLDNYFANHNIKGLSIDFYYDRWIKTVMDILFEYVLYYEYQTPVVTICEKCQKMIMFIEDGFNICNFNKNYLYEQVYQDIKDNETYPKSIDIANNIMNNLELVNINYIRDNKEKRDDSSVNIIYYDENAITNYDEIISDSLIFEKECNGTFLFIWNPKSFIIILREFKENKKNPKFHLICPGSQFEKLINILGKYKDIQEIIIGLVIYTLKADKYSYLAKKYKINGIFTKPQEILQYIKQNKNKNNIIYKVPKIITFDDYNEKYIEFHKIISLQYGKLYQKSSYLTAINILEDYLVSEKKNEMDSYDISLLLSNLEVFSAPQRDYKKIIQEYTNESFYKLFNKWLNEVDPLAIKKIAFFISGLQLSLNIYGMKEKKGFNDKAKIYRGVLISYSLITNYLRNIGKIITFPSFLSTSLDYEVAKDFSHYKKQKKEKNGLFSTIYDININPKNDWISQGFRIDAISYYQNEKEILFQPFCFFKLVNVKVDMDNFTCCIYLELIGKKEIWEGNMDNTSNIYYEPKENFIELVKKK